MKSYITKTIKHPLISGSVVIFVGTFAANTLNFLFNFFMTRNLSLADAGVLLSLISLLTLMTLPAGSIALTVVNFAASLFAKKETEKVYGLFYNLTLFFIGIGIAIMLLFSLLSHPIGAFFNIQDTSLIFIIGIAIAVCYIGIVNGGMLQAKLSFFFIALSNLFGAGTKLLFGVVFVLMGFSVKGAVLAFTLSFLLSYLFSFIPLRQFLKFEKIREQVRIGELFSYGLPTMIALFSLNSLISTDILLVKHFFDPQSAGLYAILSLIGRIIFYLIAPIGVVMFPLIVQKYTKKESYHEILRLALFLVLVPSIGLIGVYFFFPEFVTSFFLKGKANFHDGVLLGLIGIFIAVFSLLFMLTNFYLSIKKTNVYIPLTCGAVAQAVLLFFFHNSYRDVVLISLSITTLLLLSLLLYLELYEKKQKT